MGIPEQALTKKEKELTHRIEKEINRRQKLSRIADHVQTNLPSISQQGF